MAEKHMWAMNLGSVLRDSGINRQKKEGKRTKTDAHPNVQPFQGQALDMRVLLLLGTGRVLHQVAVRQMRPCVGSARLGT